jgi:hypothetical protein
MNVVDNLRFARRSFLRIVLVKNVMQIELFGRDDTSPDVSIDCLRFDWSDNCLRELFRTDSQTTEKDFAEWRFASDGFRFQGEGIHSGSVLMTQ